MRGGDGDAVELSNCEKATTAATEANAKKDEATTAATAAEEKKALACKETSDKQVELDETVDAK
jgi:hypothetical protein